VASAKIIYSKQPNKDGTISISLQIIHHRVAYPKLIARVQDKNWDRKRMEVRRGEENYIMINEMIIDELTAAKKYIIDCAHKKIDVNPHAFFGRVKGKGLVEAIRDRADYWDSKGSFGNANKYRAVANKIEGFKMDVSIEAMTTDWIDRYDQLNIEAKNRPNTRRKDMTVISPTLNHFKVFNPLIGYRKPSNKSTKAKLRKDEFERFCSVLVDDPFDDMARKAWVLSTLARGIRVFDLLTLRWSNVTEGRLIYYADKGKEKKRKSIKITPAIQSIIDTLDRTDEYLFPFVKWPYSMYESANLLDRKRYKARVNRHAFHINQSLQRVALAAGINKHITNHVARHTFAFLSMEAHVSLGKIQNMLGHGNINTTRIYTEELMEDEELDDAADQVF
jgi:integrase/recombinase XerD